MIVHSVGISDFNADLRFLAVYGACPYGETVFLVFLDTYSEKAFVFDTGVFMAVSGVAKTYVVWIAIKRSVLAHLYFAESIPSHKGLGKFE